MISEEAFDDKKDVDHYFEEDEGNYLVSNAPFS